MLKNKNAVALGKLGGSATSEAKTKAVRANGALGGRPKGSARNRRCTCGSGKKFKVCCGAALWLEDKSRQGGEIRTNKEICDARRIAKNAAKNAAK